MNRKLIGAGLAAAGLAAAGLVVGGVASVSAASSLQIAQLEPGQEVAPFSGIAGADGNAIVQFKPAAVCVQAAFRGFNPALFHIHRGPAGTNGPVVVDFSGLIRGRVAAGCVPAAPALVAAIRTNGDDYYLNAHLGLPPGPDFFKGVRAQLG